MQSKLTFNGHQFIEVDHGGQPCITLSEVAQVLYGKGAPQSATPFDSRVRDLYRRHADEFSESMTAIVKLHTAGGAQDVRVFSVRGCHMLAMFARTPVAKEFRKWALDVIEQRTRDGKDEIPVLMKALADLAGEKAVASIHGRGLKRWQKVKPEKMGAIDRLLEHIQPGLFPN